MIHSFEKCFEMKPEYETDNLRILYYDLKEGYTGKYKSYEYNRICTILDGQKNVRVNDGSPFSYDENEFILLPPNSSIDMVIEKNTKAIVYEVSDSLIHHVQEHVQSRLQTDLVIENRDNIKSHQLDPIKFQTKRINDLFTSSEPDQAFLIDLCTQELVYNLIKHNYIPDTYNKHLHDPIHFTLQYIREHVSENISLSELAYQLNLSPSNLSLRFKKRTGLNFKEYINLLKIKKAREELTSKTVTEVCYALGYENISYFISLFKKQYGETPKQYSMRIKASQTNPSI